MIVEPSTLEQLEWYSFFQSRTEFEKHAEKWLAAYKEKFPKAELIGFLQLIQFSKEIPGVCCATIASMLKAIEEENPDQSISRDSFKRMIKKAKGLGIFTVYKTTRENGSQSSNLYVFHRYPSL